MRNAGEIEHMILEKAVGDERIRAVLLNGSRANAKIKPDKFQDFDIVYVVEYIEDFLSDHEWVKIFGDILIRQLPDEMILTKEEETPAFHYLMLFKDGNRIDLTLFPVDKLKSHYRPDSLTIVLLDKDDMFSNLPPPSDRDYLVSIPTLQEFADCCNEFWWVCPYVAKGLCRKQLIYAKSMFEGPLRKMFLKMVEWHIGIDHRFSVSIGNSGKFVEQYVSPALYERILQTYPDQQPQNIWRSLLAMTVLFSELGLLVAASLKVRYNKSEEENVRKYLNDLFREYISAGNNEK
jgi:aminoglycoside 6-adenylyltransferase